MGFLDFIRNRPNKSDIFRRRLKESINTLVGERLLCKFARPDYYFAHLGDDGYYDWEDITIESISPSGFHILYRKSMSGEKKQVTVDSFVEDICFPREIDKQSKIIRRLYSEVFG